MVAGSIVLWITTIVPGAAVFEQPARPEPPRFRLGVVENADLNDLGNAERLPRLDRAIRAAAANSRSGSGRVS